MLVMFFAVLGSFRILVNYSCTHFDEQKSVIISYFIASEWKKKKNTKQQRIRYELWSFAASFRFVSNSVINWFNWHGFHPHAGQWVFSAATIGIFFVSAHYIFVEDSRCRVKYFCLPAAIHQINARNVIICVRNGGSICWNVSSVFSQINYNCKIAPRAEREAHLSFADVIRTRFVNAYAVRASCRHRIVVATEQAMNVALNAFSNVDSAMRLMVIRQTTCQLFEVNWSSKFSFLVVRRSFLPIGYSVDQIQIHMQCRKTVSFGGCRRRWQRRKISMKCNSNTTQHFVADAWKRTRIYVSNNI